MKPRNRIFIIMAVLLVIALCWYLFSTNRSGELQLIGTVDANEVVVSSRIQGRIESLAVQEGDKVTAGQLLATIQAQDLAAARNAAEATARSNQFKLAQSRDAERQTLGDTESQLTAAEAQVRVARASLAQAQAQYEHQEADTRRAVALAKAGVTSEQTRDEMVTSLNAAKAAVESAQENLAAQQAALKTAQANLYQAKAAAETVDATRADVHNAQDLLDQAQVQLGYANIVSPVTGIVNVRAALEGEVVAPTTPIVTIVDLSQTWVYAPLPETQEDAVQLGDKLRVVMPSGASLTGTVIAKAAVADFATQRDVSRRKRDIETIQLKLLIPNPGMKYVPGMTAQVYIPKDKLVNQ
ncbi:MAG TPA: efflux RND transporter periplasmic adaptor subunit [Acidobacteriaceae bacterium]|jgi:multidrug resistance efflux pump|nr:efflux RND transporter periplasmic adaptor subunit [Acidobacteriaceae bacterium]